MRPEENHRALTGGVPLRRADRAVCQHNRLLVRVPSAGHFRRCDGIRASTNQHVQRRAVFHANVHIRREGNRVTAPFLAEQPRHIVIVDVDAHAARTSERTHDARRLTFLRTHLERLEVDFTHCLLRYPRKQVQTIAERLLIVQRAVLHVRRQTAGNRAQRFVGGDDARQNRIFGRILEHTARKGRTMRVC